MSLKAQMLANLVLWDLSIWLVSLFMVTRRLPQGLLEDTLSEKKRTFSLYISLISNEILSQKAQ